VRIAPASATDFGVSRTKDIMNTKTTMAALVVILSASIFGNEIICGQYINSKFWHELNKSHSLDLATSSAHTNDKYGFVSKLFISCSENMAYGSVNFHEGFQGKVQGDSISGAGGLNGKIKSISDTEIEYRGQRLTYINNENVFDQGGQYSQWYFKSRYKGKYCSRDACIELEDGNILGKFNLYNVGICFDISDTYGVNMMCGTYSGANRCYEYSLKNDSIRISEIPDGFPEDTSDFKQLFEGRRQK